MNKTLLSTIRLVIGFCCITNLVAAGTTNGIGAHASLDFIRVSDDGRHFALSDSGSRFTPWGFNYDRDRNGRLLETYWQKEWATVVQDFQEMKMLGANTVRIHLQTSRFMQSAQEPNQESLQQLGRLLRLAEGKSLYLDITGLGCYDKKDVPQWYNDLNEEQRWNVQARFWTAVAKTCANNPAVFCYDLMNEPLVSEDKTNRDWTPGAFGDRYFTQRVTLDFKGRTPEQIAKDWVNKLVAAIRKQDPVHLITIGEIPWALYFPGAKSIFQSKEVGGNLNFVSVHFYPQQFEIKKALDALDAYNVGKPIVIEEMFPLNCSMPELEQFIEGSKPITAGWIGFYWGETIAEYKQKPQANPNKTMIEWLQYLSRRTPEILSINTFPPP